jgi:small-conductance mechanosensitive channel
VSNLSAALPILALTLLIGITADLVRSRILVPLAQNRGWRTIETTLKSLRGLTTMLAVIAGIGLASARFNLEPRTLANLNTALRAAAILVVTAKLATLTGHLTRLFTSREDAPLPSSTIFVNLGRGLMWLLGILILLAALDFSITPLLTALGVGGLAVGLALQPTLENLFSGVQVLMSRQIEPGDFVRLETGEEGWIEDVTWRNTTIKMVSNDLVIVPNATIGKSRIVNFTSADEQHSVVVELNVAYGSDLDQVERTVLEVAASVQREVDGATRAWDPLVRFTGFGDSSIGLIAVLRVTQYTDRFPVRHEFIKRINTQFIAEGIEIPFPQRTVHLAGAETAAD